MSRNRPRSGGRGCGCLLLAILLLGGLVLWAGGRRNILHLAGPAPDTAELSCQLLHLPSQEVLGLATPPLDLYYTIHGTVVQLVMMSDTGGLLWFDIASIRPGMEAQNLPETQATDIQPDSQALETFLEQVVPAQPIVEFLLNLSPSIGACYTDILQYWQRNQGQPQVAIPEKQGTAAVTAPDAAMVNANANIWSGPGFTYDIVSIAVPGTPVRPIGRNRDGSWLQLESGRWIQAARVDDVPEHLPVTEPGVPGTPTPMPAAGDRGASPDVSTVNANANIRAGPGFIHDIVSGAVPGTPVRPIGRSRDGSWLQLESGWWIHASLVDGIPEYLPVTEPVVPGTPTPIPAAGDRGVSPDVPTVNANANIRAGPGFIHDIVSGAVPGTPVRPIGRSRNGNWLQLESGWWIHVSLVDSVPEHLPVAEPVVPATPTPVPVAGGNAVPSAMLATAVSSLRAQALAHINAARTRHGVSEVIGSDNIAAQQHAEEMHRERYLSHWNRAGLAPYMRYTLAGGQGYGTENVAYIGNLTDQQCIPHDSEEWMARILDNLMESPGHRDNILRAQHRAVNLGIMHSCSLLTLVQVFDGTYVRYVSLPAIQQGRLALHGHTQNGARVPATDLGLVLQITWDPIPQPLSRGQLFHSACYTLGQPVALIRAPLDPPWYYPDEYTVMATERCLTPYDALPEAQFPRNIDDFTRRRQAIEAMDIISETHTVPYLTAEQWLVHGDEFQVVVDISSILAQWGSGVYTILLIGEVDREQTVLSEYALFVS